MAEKHPARVRIAAFLAVLPLLLGGAALAGAAIEPHGDDPTAREAAQEDHGAAGTGHAPDPVRGLAVAQDGLRVVVEQPELRRGRSERLRFRIADERGRAVRDFDVAHEKRMHLILARRDLTGFQHLHPALEADGTWTADVRLRDAGSYRLFADFSHAGTPRTLAADLRVDGAADLRPLPAPRRAAVGDGGYDVRLDAGRARPGEEADLRFAITRDGRPVRTEPYLGTQEVR